MRSDRTPIRLTKRRDRRGVTLIEMLVAVALLVLVMTILVAIFRSATGAITAAQTFETLDQNLRRLDSVIRKDLQGCTARFTPGFTRPADNRGYFEYGEGALADLQGEDSDDYIAFTAKAPEGQPFIGRFYVRTVIPTTAGPLLTGVDPILSHQPITITSDFAEIIYFCRNGNLYRRVLLIAPERATALDVGRLSTGLLGTTGPSPATTPGGGYGTDSVTSPNPFGTGFNVSWQGLNDISVHPSPIGIANIPIPNSLGDLTNRENRFARPRFSTDYRTHNTGGGAPGNTPDGIPDDENQDGNMAWFQNGIHDYYPTLYPNVFTLGLINEPVLTDSASGPAYGPAQRLVTTLDSMPFPFLFPGAYSKLAGTAGLSAWVAANHPSTGALHSMDPVTAAADLTGASTNHSPLLTGDSLPAPNIANPNSLQTWWGFPTWRETMNQFWTDPVVSLGVTHTQNSGLSWVTPSLLPPVTDDPFSDSAAIIASGTTFFAPLGVVVYQDDLIMTGVRSFDVKAYDNSPRVFNPTTGAVVGLTAGYYDLGYEQRSDLFPAGAFPNSDNQTPPFILGSFAHEGRIPPRNADNRVDSQQASFGVLAPNPIGDDSAGVLRLRRVWDSWSTDYSFVPGTPTFPNYGFPFQSPTYPSYPPPYPAPLRGIQINIRASDARGQYSKAITIRQDFTDKLE
jgi:prepilin-type N-terminal cleavage/methylation domain-containing protein